VIFFVSERRKKMKLDITEEEFLENVSECQIRGIFNTRDLTSYMNSLDITFRQEIDWEAETHYPREIPDKWLVEMWDNVDQYRWVGFLEKPNRHTYDNYRAIKKEDWPKWAIEAHKSLEDQVAGYLGDVDSLGGDNPKLERVSFNYRGVELELDIESEDNGQVTPEFCVHAVYHKGVDITEVLSDSIISIDNRYNEVQRMEFMEASRGGRV
jgi:hypothetical protein